MNEEQQLVGYDAYGRPVYAAAPPRQQPPYEPYPPQAPYSGQVYEQQYGYDPSGAPAGPGPHEQYDPYDEPYDGPHGGPYGGPHQHQQPQPQQPQQQWPPQQAVPVPEPRRGEPDRAPTPDYRTEQFAFLDQPDEESDDVIDWLKFTESRTERREEARRRGRNRVVALIVVLALFVAGGVGYLWYAGKLPGLDGPDRTQAAGTPAGPQKRDIIVVHLHHTKTGGTSTALLVDNVTTRHGATVLLPGALAVPRDDGSSVPLAKSVEEDGLGGTREGLDTLLGTRIGGTWRLDTPYLENLVELVGGIEVDTDTAVPADDRARTPAVGQGPKQSLNGAMAVAYATYRAQNEPEARQLERFGKVLLATLRKVSSDPRAATVTVETLAQILDPSLNEQALGASLAKLAEHAKVGDHRTDLVTVKPDGTLTDEAGRKVVKEVLGGAVTGPQSGAAPRVGLRDGTGDDRTHTAAKAALMNGGYSLVDGGRAGQGQATSQITYQDDAQRDRAVEVAKTLGLPESAVKKAESPLNADVVVTLGKDYKPS
ncbi:LCP family protein [Streptomyces antimicrobicus]|uniref:LCP family protein n=1 Tax=Streptomyces antimicrobicus TaxID=2883108 RepID=A0ABS8B0U3_9ACTN|nr:LCP family protein [Streptomyces antimicrobicus]MCB5178187.1 LCP family protein [Streptomyces antimicrobicus]